MKKKSGTKKLLAAAILILSFSFILALFFLNRKPEETATVQAYSPVHHVLFISSYSESFATVDLQKKGLEEAFGSSVEMDIAYMDTKQYNSAENTALFYQLLSYKLAHHDPYDAVILGDDAALTFGETYQQELFNGIPMIFFCVNDTDHAVLAGENPWITGAVEKFYLSDTLDIAARFQPQANKVVVIYDDTQTGRGDQVQYQALKEQYPDYQFSGLDFSAYTLQEFEAQLQAIDSSSIVIYMDAFQDADGNQYTIDQSVPIIAANTSVPVYRTSIGGVGSGLLGGMMVSYEDLGKQAGEMVNRVLNGESVSDIPVETGGIGNYYFDVNVLEKYNISRSLVPANAVLINQTPDFLSLHRGALLFLAFLLVLISSFFSVFLYFKQKSSNLEKRNLDRILKNLPVGISASTYHNGKLIGRNSNERFDRMMKAGSLADSFLGKPSPAGIHPLDRERIMNARKELSSRESAVHYTFRYNLDPQAKTLWYSVDSRSVMEKDGSLTLYSVLNDITAEKEAEAGRERNRTMYELAAEMAGLCLWKYEVHSHRILMSDTKSTQKLCEQYQIPELLEHVPESGINWISSNDYDKYKKIFQRIEEGEKQVSAEYWYKPGADGRQRCEHVIYYTVFDTNGNPSYAYGIGQDITLRKIEERNYQRLYQQMAEANPDSVCFFRLNLSRDLCSGGQSKYPDLLTLQQSGTASGMFARVIAAIRDEQIQKDCEETFRISSLLHSFQNGTANLEREFPVRTMNAQYRWFRGNIHMVQNPETDDIEAVISGVDVTKRKKDEQIIQMITMENHDFIGLIDSASGTVSLHDGIWGSKGYLNSQPHSYQEVITRYAEQYVAEDDRQRFLQSVALPALLLRLQQETRPVCTYTLLSADGKRQKKRLYFTWLDSMKREIMAAQSDITDAYEQEQARNRQLKAALDMAEKASHAKSEFVSRISHDIRTPISAITSMTEFALQDIDNPEILRNDLNKIRSSNTFLLSLINDILDISKIDSGQIALHPEPYSCEDCMQNIENMFQPLCREKGIHFETVSDSDGTVPLTDKIRINQILLNLISNAVKYTPRGGTVRVALQCKKTTDRLLSFLFEVQDTGIGMSQEFQDVMFEPFTQDENNQERIKLAGGTGLGLSIVKKLVDLMGGSITVSSRIGHGSRISVSCTFSAYNGNPSDAFSQEAGESNLAKLQGTVLLAEDNQINAEIATRLLDSMGLQTEHAENGAIAVSMFRASASGHYLCILMDIRMPVMNGYEAAAAIRKMNHPDAGTIPIIALTADAIREDSAAVSSNMNAYLTKPIDSQILRRTIADLTTASK